MGSLSVYIDCSGSISNSIYLDFLSEVQGIVDILHPELLTVVNWGSNIGSIVEIRADDDIMDMCSLEYLGGTVIRNPLKHARSTKPEVAVFLTDMEFFSEYDDLEPECDVLLVAHGAEGVTVPFGTVIDLPK